MFVVLVQTGLHYVPAAFHPDRLLARIDPIILGSSGSGPDAILPDIWSRIQLRGGYVRKGETLLVRHELPAGSDLDLIVMRCRTVRVPLTPCDAVAQESLNIRSRRGLTRVVIGTPGFYSFRSRTRAEESYVIWRRAKTDAGMKSFAAMSKADENTGGRS
ncbi:MAG: hypothetical protein WBG08_06475 [Litorimonas sp.]